MVELKLRTNMLGDFKIPNSVDLVMQRWETNGLWFAVNYILILIIGLILGIIISVWVFIIAINLVIGHATLKTRTISSKANLLKQKAKM